jgi:stearoyl-CoA desaturase (delta-9 desaturase)
MMLQDKQENLKLNPLVFVVLVVYPIMLLALGIWYGVEYGISSFEILLFVVGYYGANISVGLGLHRLWAHNAYKVNKVVEFILAFLSAGTLQGPALVWASDHHKHHTFTDEEDDPHSPLKYKNRIKGFFWSHMGWMLYGQGPITSLNKVTMVKLGRNEILRWQMKYYWQIATFMNAVLPPIVGYICFHTIQGALAGYVFIGLARAFQQQMTFCVNSLTHFIGKKQYYNGTAGDIWWMFIFLLGENWHNFHHAFANDYRNGVKWWHFDVHKWLIAGLEKVGLASDLVRTSDVRIRAKVEATRAELTENVRTNLSVIEEAAEYIAKAAYERLDQAEKSAEHLAHKMHDKILELRLKALNLAKNVQDALTSAETLSRNISIKYIEQFHKLENLARKLNITLPQFQGL